MTFASNMQQVAQRLLLKFGETCSFTRELEGEFDPNTGSLPVPTIYTYEANGCPLNYNKDEIDGSTVLETDLQVWVEVNSDGDIPAVGDVLTFEHDTSTQYRVLVVSPLFAQGSRIAYRLQVRI